MPRFKKCARAKPPSLLAPFPSTPPSPPAVKMDAVNKMELAIAVVRGGNLITALKLVDYSLKLYPDSAALHLTRSGIYFRAAYQFSHDGSAAQVAHLETALDANRRAVQLAPNSIFFALYHAATLFHLAQNDAALEYDYNAVIQTCEQALLLENPTNPVEDLLGVGGMAFVKPSPVNRIEQVKKKLAILLEKSKENAMKVFKNLKKDTNNDMNFQDIKQTAEDVCCYSYRDLYTERLRTPISILQAFDRCSVYNSCFPPIQILDWFSHSSNEPQVEIELPPIIHNKDRRWMGLALCASFSVYENSTVIHENLEQETCHYLICCLETAIDSIEPHHVYLPTGEDVELLYLGGFMWLSYIPRISLPDWLNQCTRITASIFSDSPSLTVQNCGLRLIYPHDEVEFKEAIRHCVASLSDTEDIVRQIAVDIHRQRNKKIYDDETIPSRMGGSFDHRLKDKGKRVVE